MRVLAVFLAAALTAFAQAPPPKAPTKVDETLRARVTQFHEYQSSGNFRKSLDLVAQDSQDYFLGMSKDRPKVFAIDQIEYSGKFTRAAVRIASTNRLLVGSRTVEVPSSRMEYWKLDSGKWFWYHDLEADRPSFFGVPVGDATERDPNLGKAVPKNTDSETIASGAQTALQGAAGRPLFDVTSLAFTLGEPGVKEVHVRNNYKGSVHLVVKLPDEQTGVLVEPLETDIEPLGEFTLKVRYYALYREPGITKLVLQLQPFPKLYPFEVTVDGAKPQAQ